VQHLYTWIQSGTFNVAFSMRLDQLSMTFVLLITGVGSLIHLYSVGYMAHDEKRKRFFAFINLFVAAMLLLVLADNYLLLYVGWEGVGLASYLLVGFWQERPAAGAAAKKAFVVNRVGDFGLSLAVMLMFVTFGTVSFGGIDAGASHASPNTVTAIGLLLLLAACGKSAQVPLQSWILDAMEGPTPVSALIHAATMVTAGVYLIVRSNALFNLSHTASNFVIAVGIVTLLFGAFIGMAKDDIKKALAGSTMSQIGYMMLGAGLGPSGYAFAIFMLLMHGFYKATLFLGAGSVMHGMNDELDMRRYGALFKYMRITSLAFIAGYLAIIGIPPFDGYFSKDKIIEVAFGHGWVVGLGAMFGAMLTAFYMTRIVAMTFFGKKRWTNEEHHPHESPWTMTVPMIILGILSLVAGALLSINSAFVDWLTPVVGFAEPDLPVSSTVIGLTTLVLVIVSAVFGWFQYARRDVPVVAPEHVTPFTVAARNELYGNTFNEAVFMRPGQYLTRSLVWFDNRVVDGAVNGSAAVVGGSSGRLRRWQTGYVRSYALSIVVGTALVVAALLLVRI
jgi:NADH-quinone oxidoreductase subunit L